MRVYFWTLNPVPLIYVSILFVFNVCSFLRERESMRRGEAEREGDTESKAGSRLWAVSTEPDAGLELTSREIMTWAEVGRLTDWATQVPPVYDLSIYKWMIKLIIVNVFSASWFFKKLVFIYFWERKREGGREHVCVQAGKGQRERETQNPKQAPGSELSAQSPTWGSNSQTGRWWPEPKLNA